MTLEFLADVTDPNDKNLYQRQLRDLQEGLLEYIYKLC